jgi:hypothetical protein
MLVTAVALAVSYLQGVHVGREFSTLLSVKRMYNASPSAAGLTTLPLPTTPGVQGQLCMALVVLPLTLVQDSKWCL